MLIIFFVSVRLADVSLWRTSGSTADVFMKKSAIETVRELLEENNVQYEVLVEDMQKQIDLERQQPTRDGQQNNG